MHVFLIFFSMRFSKPQILRRKRQQRRRMNKQNYYNHNYFLVAFACVGGVRACVLETLCVQRKFLYGRYAYVPRCSRRPEQGTEGPIDSSFILNHSTLRTVLLARSWEREVTYQAYLLVIGTVVLLPRTKIDLVSPRLLWSFARIKTGHPIISYRRYVRRSKKKT